MRITVLAPTGHVGRRVVGRLLGTPHTLTLLCRDPAKLPDAVRATATVVQGALEDAAALGQAFTGADAAFLLIPPNFTAADWIGWMRDVGEQLAEAVQATGVRRVVFVSSIGADHAGLGPISCLGEIEPRLRAAAPSVVTLRAGYFMENLLNATAAIRAEGTLYQAHPADLPIPFTATADIGDVAADELLDAGASGHRTREVLGADDRSFADVARVLGDALGRTVAYVEVPVDAVRQALLGMGASDSVAAGYAEMLTGLNATRFPHGPRTGVTSTPTTLEAFARDVLVPAVRNG